MELSKGVRVSIRTLVRILLPLETLSFMKTSYALPWVIRYHEGI